MPARLRFFIIGGHFGFLEMLKGGRSASAWKHLLEPARQIIIKEIMLSEIANLAPSSARLTKRVLSKRLMIYLNEEEL